MARDPRSPRALAFDVAREYYFGAERDIAFPGAELDVVQSLRASVGYWSRRAAREHTSGGRSDLAMRAARAARDRARELRETPQTGDAAGGHALYT
jgi:hypothetical protein